MVRGACQVVATGAEAASSGSATENYDTYQSSLSSSTIREKYISMRRSTGRVSQILASIVDEPRVQGGF